MLVRLAAVMTVCLGVSPVFAAIIIGSGGQLSLGQGQIDLAGGDLHIRGSVELESGRMLDAGNVQIDGNLDGGNGEITVLGDWINNGTFEAGTSRVQMEDSTGQGNSIRGESTFHALSLVSAAGGAFVLEVGLVQRIMQSLTILGTEQQPLQIRSSLPPQLAFILLEQGGVQDISSVGVSNVHAIGVPLAPDETNQGGTGNDNGWFSSGLFAVPVPGLTASGLLILILASLLVGLRQRGLSPS